MHHPSTFDVTMDDVDPDTPDLIGPMVSIY